MKLCIFTVSVAISLGAVACGGGDERISAPNVAWAKSVKGTAMTYLAAVASFPDGSSVAVGAMEGSIVLGAGEANETTLSTSDGIDGALARYAADGTLLWARRLAGVGESGPASTVAVTTDGDVMVAGFFGYMGGPLTLGQGEPNETTLVSAGDDDGFVARYSGEGALRWARRLGSTGVDQAIALTALPGGAATVAGLFEGTVTFGEGEPNATALTGVSWMEGFVARYEADGALAWAKGTSSLGYAAVWSVASGADGSVYVGGSFTDTIALDGDEGGSGDLGSVEGSADVFVARLAPDGTPLWTRDCGGGGYEELWGIAVAPDGSVRLTGGFFGTATFGAEGASPVALTVTPSGTENGFLASFGPDGTFQWARQTEGRDAGTESEGLSVSVGPDGATVLVGVFEGTMVLHFDDGTEATFTSLGGEDAFVARYGSNGALEWAEAVGSAGDDAALGVAVMTDGSLAVCGCYHGVVTFGAGDDRETTLDDDGQTDAFVARFNKNGKF